MRCAVLTTSVSRLAGGLFVSTRKLTQTLQQRGVNAEVWGITDQHSADDRPAWADLKLNIFDVQGPRSFAYAPGYSAALHAYAPDLVHCHGLWQYPSIACSRWATRKQRPYLISPRGMLDPWALANSRLRKRIAAIGFQNRHLRNAACLHALSQSEADAIRAYGLRNPICVIPNGIDLPEPATMPPPWNAQAVGDRRVLLFLGRLHPKKGLPHLLTAWQILTREQPALVKQWCIIIAGWDDGGHRSALETQVRTCGMEDSILFTGPLHDAPKAAAFAHADGFVLPSFSEGMPMAVLEAWSFGLPVLMTPECNIPEGFTRNAAIKMSADIAGACAGLRCITGLSTDERYAMARNGRDLVTERFTWAIVAQQMHAVYQWMLGTGAQPTCVQTA